MPPIKFTDEQIEFTDEQIELSWVTDVDLEYLRTHKKNLYWGLILEQNKLKEEWLSEFEPYITAQYDPNDLPYDLWCTLTSTQNLSLEWIRQHTHMINFDVLIQKSKLDKKILYEYLDKFSFGDICKYQNLDEEFICKYQERIDWNFISSYTDLTVDFIIQFKDKLNWEKISYVYKFEPVQLKQIEDLIIKKNNLLYLSADEIISRLSPNVEFYNNNKYVVGYMNFTSYNNVIYCHQPSLCEKISWESICENNNVSEGKEFEANVFNYKLYDPSDINFDEKIVHYGFVCENTIKECVRRSFNCGSISEHIIKVLMPIETTIPAKHYGVYDVFYAKKIIIVGEVFYNYEK